MNPLNWWSNHGTKIIGAITATLGSLMTLDPATLTTLFGVKGSAIAVAVSGFLTIWRGFGNSSSPKSPE